MLLPIWLIVLLILAIVLYRHFDKRRLYWPSKGVPGPKSPFLIGHYWSLRMAKKMTIIQLRNWTEQFGKFFGLLDGPRRILVISDLRMVHELLVTKFDLFEARKLNTAANSLSEFNAASILHVTSYRWKRLRNIAATFFNGFNVKKTIPAMQIAIGKHLQKLGKNRDILQGHPVNIQPFLQNLSDDILVRLIFGDSKARGQKYFQLMGQAIEAKKRPIAKLFSLLSTTFPWTKPCVNALNGLLATNNHFNTLLFHCLQQKVRKMRVEKANLARFTFVEYLLTAECEEENGTDVSGKQVARYLLTDEIVSACINFLYAGHKTLARALNSLVFCLASNLEVQRRLFEEGIAPLGEDEAISFDAIEAMPLLDSAVRESLRLFPLGSEHVSRKCMAKTTLGGRIQLEPDDFVMVDVLSIHFSQELWGDNAAMFDPSRWENIRVKNGSRYLSFGQGLRMCLGERLAMFQLKLVLVHLLRKYHIVAEKDNAMDNNDKEEEELMQKQLLVRLVPR